MKNKGFKIFNRGASLCVMALLTMLSIMTASAQQKEFTLEDLNFGGNNYHNMTPKNRYLTWWGDQLVRLDVEECSIVDKKTGKEKPLFTVDDINKWAGTTADSAKIYHLFYASFPYPDKTLVLVNRKGERLLIDFKAKKQYGDKTPKVKLMRSGILLHVR